MVELTPEHEAKCLRCGRCCMGALPVDGKWVILKHMYCRHLDPETKLCKVYPQRFAVASWCMDIEKAAKGGALWEHCPYTSLFPGIRKVEISDEEYLEKWPVLVHILTNMANVPTCFSWDIFVADAERREPRWTWEMRRGPGVDGPRSYVIRRRATLWEWLSRAIARWRSRV